MVIASPTIMLQNNMNTGVKQTLLYVVFCSIFLLIVGLVNLKKKNEIFTFYTNRLDSFWFALLIVLAIRCLISQPITALIDGKSTTIESDPYIIISALFFAPIFEETIFRGILLRGLLTRYSILTSILLSSILFALIHVNVIQVISALLLGLLFGLIFIKTHSLIYTIVLHFFANLITWICTYLNIKNFCLTCSSITLIIVATLGLLLYGYSLWALNKINSN